MSNVNFTDLRQSVDGTWYPELINEEFSLEINNENYTPIGIDYITVKLREIPYISVNEIFKKINISVVLEAENNSKIKIFNPIKERVEEFSRFELIYKSTDISIHDYNCFIVNTTTCEVGFLRNYFIGKNYIKCKVSYYGLGTYLRPSYLSSLFTDNTRTIQVIKNIDREPTLNDVNYEIGTQWIYNNVLYMLVSKLGSQNKIAVWAKLTDIFDPQYTISSNSRILFSRTGEILFYFKNYLTAKFACSQSFSNEPDLYLYTSSCIGKNGLLAINSNGKVFTVGLEDLDINKIFDIDPFKLFNIKTDDSLIYNSNTKTLMHNPGPKYRHLPLFTETAPGTWILAIDSQRNPRWIEMNQQFWFLQNANNNEFFKCVYVDGTRNFIWQTINEFPVFNMSNTITNFIPSWFDSSVINSDYLLLCRRIDSTTSYKWVQLDTKLFVPQNGTNGDVLCYENNQIKWKKIKLIPDDGYDGQVLTYTYSGLVFRYIKEVPVARKSGMLFVSVPSTLEDNSYAGEWCRVIIGGYDASANLVYQKVGDDIEPFVELFLEGFTRTKHIIYTRPNSYEIVPYTTISGDFYNDRFIEFRQNDYTCLINNNGVSLFGDNTNFSIYINNYVKDSSNVKYPALNYQIYYRGALSSNMVLDSSYFIIQFDNMHVRNNAILPFFIVDRNQIQYFNNKGIFITYGNRLRLLSNNLFTYDIAMTLSGNHFEENIRWRYYKVENESNIIRSFRVNKDKKRYTFYFSSLDGTAYIDELNEYRTVKIDNILEFSFWDKTIFVANDETNIYTEKRAQYEIHGSENLIKILYPTLEDENNTLESSIKFGYYNENYNFKLPTIILNVKKNNHFVDYCFGYDRFFMLFNKKYSQYIEPTYFIVNLSGFCFANNHCLIGFIDNTLILNRNILNYETYIDNNYKLFNTIKYKMVNIKEDLYKFSYDNSGFNYDFISLDSTAFLDSNLIERKFNNKITLSFFNNFLYIDDSTTNKSSEKTAQYEIYGSENLIKILYPTLEDENNTFESSIKFGYIDNTTNFKSPVLIFNVKRNNFFANYCFDHDSFHVLFDKNYAQISPYSFYINKNGFGSSTGFSQFIFDRETAKLIRNVYQYNYYFDNEFNFLNNIVYHGGFMINHPIYTFKRSKDGFIYNFIALDFTGKRIDNFWTYNNLDNNIFFNFYKRYVYIADDITNIQDVHTIKINSNSTDIIDWCISFPLLSQLNYEGKLRLLIIPHSVDYSPLFALLNMLDDTRVSTFAFNNTGFSFNIKDRTDACILELNKNSLEYTYRYDSSGTSRKIENININNKATLFFNASNFFIINDDRLITDQVNFYVNSEEFKISDATYDLHISTNIFKYISSNNGIIINNGDTTLVKDNNNIFIFSPSNIITLLKNLSIRLNNTDTTFSILANDQTYFDITKNTLTLANRNFSIRNYGSDTTISNKYSSETASIVMHTEGVTGGVSKDFLYINFLINPTNYLATLYLPMTIKFYADNDFFGCSTIIRGYPLTTFPLESAPQWYYVYEYNMNGLNVYVENILYNINYLNLYYKCSSIINDQGINKRFLFYTTDDTTTPILLYNKIEHNYRIYVCDDLNNNRVAMLYNKVEEEYELRQSNTSISIDKEKSALFFPVDDSATTIIVSNTIGSKFPFINEDVTKYNIYYTFYNSLVPNSIELINIGNVNNFTLKTSGILGIPIVNIRINQYVGIDYSSFENYIKSPENILNIFNILELKDFANNTAMLLAATSYNGTNSELKLYLINRLNNQFKVFRITSEEI